MATALLVLTKPVIAQLTNDGCWQCQRSAAATRLWFHEPKFALDSLQLLCDREDPKVKIDVGVLPGCVISESDLMATVAEICAP